MGDASAPEKYRIRVRTPDGQEVVSDVVTMLARDAGLKNARWDTGGSAADGALRASHGDTMNLIVDAPGLDGRHVRFLIEHNDYGKWTLLADAAVPVQGGVARASIPVQHPGGDSPKSKTDAAPVNIRFRVELVS